MDIITVLKTTIFWTIITISSDNGRKVDITVNDKTYFLDLQASLKHSLFLRYREDLLFLVGLYAEPYQVRAANKFLAAHHPEYREIIEHEDKELANV